MPTTTATTRFKPWLIRRTAYLIVGAVLLILGYLGVINEHQIDAVNASPLLGTLVSWIAAFFTHEGSDSRATDEDVKRAGEAARVDVEKLATEVAGKLIPALPLPTVATLPVYSGPTSTPQQ